MRVARAASPSITGKIGWLPGLSVKPAFSRPARRRRGVGVQPVAQVAALADQLQRLQRRHDDRRRQGVGEEIRPRALPQHVDDLGPAAGEAAGRAAQRLAQRAGDDVHAVQHAEMLRRAAAGRAEDAGGVAVVHHHDRVVPVGQVADLRQLRQRRRPSRRRRRWRSGAAGCPASPASPFPARPCRRCGSGSAGPCTGGRRR